MAYKKFTLRKLKTRFGIQNKVVPLFDGALIDKVPISHWLNDTLSRGNKLIMRSQKARSEAIMMPILLELKERNNHFFMIHSGNNFQVDKEKGLDGKCDFILNANPVSLTINIPLMPIVYAKKGIELIGVNHCSAQMYAAKVDNERNAKPIDIIYGCVTTSHWWRFMKLENNWLYVDEKTYYIDELETILGIFQHIIDYYKSILEPVAA